MARFHGVAAGIFGTPVSARILHRPLLRPLASLEFVREGREDPARGYHAGPSPDMRSLQLGQAQSFAGGGR